MWSTVDWTEERPIGDTGNSIAVSPDGRQIAVTRGDFMRRRGVALLNSSNWSEQAVLPEVWGPLAFSPDSSRLAADSEAGIKLWPVSGGGKAILLENSTNLLGRVGPAIRSDRCIAFSPDGRFVVIPRNTVSERGVFVLSIWDAQTGHELATLPDDPAHIEHTSAISALAFSPDGALLATASLDYSVRLWDFNRRERMATLQGHLSEVWSLAFTADGHGVVSGDRGGSVKVWPVRRQQKDDVLAGVAWPLGISPDGRVVAAMERSQAVVYYNLATGEPDLRIELEPVRFRIPAVAVSADLRVLVQGLGNGTAKLWDTEQHESRTISMGDRPLDLVALSPDGILLVAAGREEGMRWRNLKSGNSGTWQIEARKAVFSPDGKRLAVQGRTNVVQVVAPDTGALQTTIALDSAQPGFTMCFSPDGTLLALACMDDTLRLFDTTTGRLVVTCAGHKQPVFSTVFSPDGRTLASASDDSTLKLWNVTTGQELLSDRRLGGSMTGLMFSADGHLLLGGSGAFSSSPHIRFFRAPEPVMVEARATRGVDR